VSRTRRSGANFSFVAAKPLPHKASRKKLGRKEVLLAGKTAAISGAASARGIGLTTARLFAAHGARVAILDIDETGAQRAAQELGEGHIGAACDVADPESCKRAARKVLDAFGTLDALVNNAGISQPVKTMEITPQD
jgi:NAD(P)-dependent dehydrogenase (short-subunit alcohol dehydrogenase family)